MFLYFFHVKGFLNNIVIQQQTYLNVADNTGAKKIMCIRILSSQSKYAYIGDKIIAVVKV